MIVIFVSLYAESGLIRDENKGCLVILARLLHK